MISRSSIPNRKDGESVVLHLRRHWFIFFRLFLIFVFFTALPIAGYLFVFTYFPQLLTGAKSRPILEIFLYVYYLALMVFALTTWTDNYLDVWTITTEKIINREQKGLFNRLVSELELYNVQDVATEQKGFFPTIFHYGDVYIQTAAEKERFIFKQVPHPYKIAKILQKLNEDAKKHFHDVTHNENSTV